MSLIQIDWNPSPRKLRQFALIWGVGFGLLGLLVAWQSESLGGEGDWTLPGLIWALAAGVGCLGLLYPEAVQPVYKIWMGITFPIGWLLSHVFLGIVYFGIFTVAGVFFRIIGRDPLDCRSSHKDSYWVERGGKSEPKRYFQQF